LFVLLRFLIDALCVLVARSAVACKELVLLGQIDIWGKISMREGKRVENDEATCLSDDENHSSANVSEGDNCDGIDPLLGVRLTTSFGPGIIEEIYDFEDRMYCTVRLCSFGTLSLSESAVEALLRKEQKLFKQGLSPLGNRPTRRLQNLTGSIRMYNPAKGWGFIVCEEFPGDIFLHSKHMVGNLPREYIGHFQSSQDGHQVKFDLDTQHRKRPQALNVRVVEVAEQEAPVYPKRSSRPSSGWRSEQVAAESGDEDFAVDDLPDDEEAPNDEDVIGAADFTVESSAADADAAAGSRAGQHWTRTQLGAKEASSTLLSPNLSAEDVQERARRKGALRMRGLPFTVTVSEVAQFFHGYGVRPEDVILGERMDGSPSGEACVLFARDELAEKARKEKHMQHLGRRYIELFNTKGTSADLIEKEQTVDLPLGPVANAKPPGPVVQVDLPGYPPQTIGALSAAITAGAMPPPPAAAAAATQYAAYAAALHAAQGAQVAPQSGSISMPPTVAPALPLAQADAAGGKQSTDPTSGSGDQAYQHYFQYFQQAYAAAVASQAVQTYAASAAHHYQQQMLATVSGAVGAEASSKAATQELPLPPDYSAEAAAAVATPTAFPISVAEAQGADYTRSTHVIEEVRWQYYNVI
jgi:cold shock CspA family protein